MIANEDINLQDDPQFVAKDADNIGQIKPSFASNPTNILLARLT
jgi:hypothetical protein